MLKRCLSARSLRQWDHLYAFNWGTIPGDVFQLESLYVEDGLTDPERGAAFVQDHDTCLEFRFAGRIDDLFVDVPVVVASEVEPGLYVQEPAMKLGPTFGGILEAGWRPPTDHRWLCHQVHSRGAPGESSRPMADRQPPDGP